jgi:NMD protein affecting ribosome stability and mRNA decay
MNLLNYVSLEASKMNIMCKTCGTKEVTDEDNLCASCRVELEKDNSKINGLISEGHTRHCACRMVWGDGECTCKKGLK